LCSVCPFSQTLKLKYGSVKATTVDYDSQEHKANRCRFIKEFAEVLKAEAEGSSVIVYYDESYLNLGHDPPSSWIPIGSNKHEREVVSSKASGRYIILHAITKDGLLHKANLEVPFVKLSCLFSG
jgi:hypothetical protein